MQDDKRKEAAKPKVVEAPPVEKPQENDQPVEPIATNQENAGDIPAKSRQPQITVTQATEAKIEPYVELIVDDHRNTIQEQQEIAAN